MCVCVCVCVSVCVRVCVRSVSVCVCVCVCVEGECVRVWGVDELVCWENTRWYGTHGGEGQEPVF